MWISFWINPKHKKQRNNSRHATQIHDQPSEPTIQHNFRFQEKTSQTVNWSIGAVTDKNAMTLEIKR